MKANLSLRFLLWVLLFSTSAFTRQAQAQKLNISVDIESVQAICRLLSQPKADTAELRKTAQLYGHTLLIKKVKGYSGAGEDVFISTLKEIIETGTVKGNDEYNWKLVKAKLPQIKSLVDYISQNKETFIGDVKKIIQPYVPASLAAEARACFLAGGGSLGFTIGNDPTFNVALQKIGDDLKGLQYLVAHELYHTMQDVGQRTRSYTADKTAPYFIKATYYQLYNLWAEGSANYVGNFLKINEPGSFGKEQQELYRKNANRRYQNFQLFEAMIYRQYYDTTADYQAIYDLGFSTAFDESSYFVGFEMAKKIAAHQGDSTIARLLTQDPLRFILDYIALYKSKPDDKTFVRFTPPIEAIIEELKKWENKL